METRKRKVGSYCDAPTLADSSQIELILMIPEVLSFYTHRNGI